MKNTLLIICLLFSVNASAQIVNYHPLLDSVNRWSYQFNIMPVSPLEAVQSRFPCNYPFYGDVMYTGGDTIIDTSVYKILYVDEFLNNNPCTFGFIREDTALRKVYFADVIGNPPSILYDFNMHTGDSILLSFNWSWGPLYFDSGYYRLDSIDSVTLQQGVRKVFHLNCHSSLNSHTLSWIEGVGNKGNLVYTHSADVNSFGLFGNCPGFPYDFINILICFEHDEKVYFDSCTYQTAVNNLCFALLDSCMYYNTCGDISEINKISLVKLAPNPFHNSTTITVANIINGNSEMRIYDAMGRLVREEIIEGKSTNLNRNALTEGLYYYQVVNDERIIANGKFVVE